MYGLCHRHNLNKILDVQNNSNLLLKSFWRHIKNNSLVPTMNIKRESFISQSFSLKFGLGCALVFLIGAQTHEMLVSICSFAQYRYLIMK
jgi:hypothetical protein